MRMTKAGTAPTPPSPSAGTSPPMSDPAGTLPLPHPDRLRRAEKLGLILFALLILGLGVVTEIRSAFLASPKTDFQVYARAAWAVRAGEDIYYHFDNNGWHYCYPPPFAVLMAPLADPYPYLPREGYLPFAVSVAVWYLIGVGCVWYAVHAFASALLPGTPRGSRRWWYARMVPVYVCVGGLGHTISRGQVNTLLVALVAAGFVAAVRGRRVASGAWLAAAAVLKIIPALLVLFPVVRRDRRALAGVVLGAVVLLGVIPAAVWGVAGAVEMNRRTVALVLAPAVAPNGADETRKLELHGAKATDSQSVQAAVHAWLYPDPATRPDTVDPVAKRVHLAVGGLMLAVTLVAGLRRLTPAPADQLVFLGCLCALMMLLTPVSHMHYYAMVLPLVCGLWLRGLAARPGAVAADRRTTLVLAVWGIATALPLFPGPVFDRLRECGFGTAATIGLWVFGLGVLGRTAAAKTEAEPERETFKIAA